MIPALLPACLQPGSAATVEPRYDICQSHSMVLLCPASMVVTHGTLVNTQVTRVPFALCRSFAALLPLLGSRRYYALQEYTRMDDCGHVNGQRSARAATRLTAGGQKYEFVISHLAPILLGSA